MKVLDYVSLALIIVGAVNWGLIGFFNFDLVTALFNGNLAFIARIVFALVGVAGLYCLSLYGKLDNTEKISQLQQSKIK